MHSSIKQHLLTVLPLAALLLSACAGNNSYTIGGTVTGLAGSAGGGPLSSSSSLVLQDNGGDNLTISANGAFTFPTALTSNAYTSATYNVTILTQPTGQTCTVTNGSGTANGDVTSVLVNCASGSTSVYVVNASANNVSQFTIGANGTLNTPVASSIATGYTPYAIAIAPSGLYAYVANNFNGAGGNNVSEYTINNAALTPNAISASVQAGTHPVSVTIDPSGSYVYVLNATSDNVSQYTINSDGTLTPGSPIQTGTTPNSLALDPVGSYAYVANYGDGTISEYNVSGGALALAATVPAPPAGNNAPASIAVDPTGQYVYVADYASNTVSEYSIGTGGALTQTGSIAAGANPISLTVSGSYVYVANFNANTSGTVGSVSEYSIGPSGALTLIGTVAAGVKPSSVAVAGSYAFVTNFGDGTISQYTINSDGTLSANTTTPTVNVTGQPIAVIAAQ
ncbi:MAG: beta-propeller fold lactonase family protein [Gallionella sp.]